MKSKKENKRIEEEYVAMNEDRPKLLNGTKVLLELVEPWKNKSCKRTVMADSFFLPKKNLPTSATKTT